MKLGMTFIYKRQVAIECNIPGQVPYLASDWIDEDEAIQQGNLLAEARKKFGENFRLAERYIPIKNYILTKI